MSIPSFLHAVVVSKKAESMTPKQIQILQQKRFRKLLRHVFQKSRFYKRYYQKHGITERDIEKVVPEDIPVINKQIIMDNYDDVVCDPVLKKDALEQFITEFPDASNKYKKVYRVLHTSGSSGTVGLFVYGPRDWVVYQALGSRTAGTKINPFKKKKLAYIGLTDGHYAGITGILEAPPLLFKITTIPISAPLEEICRNIDRFQPNNLFGYASGVNLLAQEQIAGHIDISPKAVSCSGDPLTPAIRKTVEKAFNVNPQDLYGATETLCFSIECKSQHRLHYFNDWFSVQVVDGDLKCVKPGQPGRIIVTNLFNYTQPLIRYQMNDEIILSDEQCECGWPFPIIEKIVGRSEETLWFTKLNGTKEFIHPIVLVEFFVPGLEKFQFVQTDTNKLTMTAVVDGKKETIDPTIKRRMTEILSQKGLNGIVQFDVKLVDHIPNDPKTGKFRLIIPYQFRN